MAWSTPIDHLFNQKALFYTFVGIIVGTTVLTLLSDSPIAKSHNKKAPLFDPQNRGRSLWEPADTIDPENWSISDLKRWLRQVFFPVTGFALRLEKYPF
jgi:hypothetical protein